MLVHSSWYSKPYHRKLWGAKQRWSKPNLFMNLFRSMDSGHWIHTAPNYVHRNHVLLLVLYWHLLLTFRIYHILFNSYGLQYIRIISSLKVGFSTYLEQRPYAIFRSFSNDIDANIFAWIKRQTPRHSTRFIFFCSLRFYNNVWAMSHFRLYQTKSRAKHEKHWTIVNRPMYLSVNRTLLSSCYQLRF